MFPEPILNPAGQRPLEGRSVKGLRHATAVGFSRSTCDRPFVEPKFARPHGCDGHPSPHSTHNKRLCASGRSNEMQSRLQAGNVNGPMGALDTPTFHANLPSDIENLKPVRRFTLVEVTFNDMDVGLGEIFHSWVSRSLIFEVAHDIWPSMLYSFK